MRKIGRLDTQFVATRQLLSDKLADVDMVVLEEIARRSYAATEDVDHCPVR